MVHHYDRFMSIYQQMEGKKKTEITFIVEKWVWDKGEQKKQHLSYQINLFCS